MQIFFNNFQRVELKNYFSSLKSFFLGKFEFHKVGCIRNIPQKSVEICEMLLLPLLQNIMIPDVNLRQKSTQRKKGGERRIFKKAIKLFLPFCPWGENILTLLCDTDVYTRQRCAHNLRREEGRNLLLRLPRAYIREIFPLQTHERKISYLPRPSSSQMNDIRDALLTFLQAYYCDII